MQSQPVIRVAVQAIAVLLAIALLATPASAEQSTAWGATTQARDASAVLAPGVYAHVGTSLGAFTIRLFEHEAPKTVENFIGLAEGSTDPATGKPGRSRPYYDGLTFHRAVPGFMVQGGDPNGDGTGGPGYRVPDEIDPVRTFDKAGLVAMASFGPNANGSQFFVTVAPYPRLPLKYTIFGEVVRGLDVVVSISRVKTDLRARPITPVVITSVRIDRVID